MLSKPRSWYTLSDYPGRLFERVRTQINGILGHSKGHVTFLLLAGHMNIAS
nr:MAG TPA: hypothetical protein [Caudoviricetes sp.]